MEPESEPKESWTPGEARGAELLEGLELSGGAVKRRPRPMVLGLAAVVLVAFAALAASFMSGMFRSSELGEAVDLKGENTARIHAHVASQSLAFRMPSRAEEVAQAMNTSAAPEPETIGEVSYRIRERGSLEDIGRMYGIPLEDMKALNPTVKSAEKDLGAGARVVVYRQGHTYSDEKRLDRGKPHLRGGIPMPDGPGRRVRRRGRSWGRPNMVVNLDHALRAYGEAYPEGPVVIVSDMSRRKGGRLKPHHTHREGQDVDLSYIPIPKHDNGGFIKMSKDYFDVDRNWTFIKAMLDTGEVTLILMDHDLQKLLFEKARAEGVPVPELRRIFQYPRPKEREVAIIRHWDKHDDHMHVRFACHADRRRCRR